MSGDINKLSVAATARTASSLLSKMPAIAFYNHPSALKGHSSNERVTMTPFSQDEKCLIALRHLSTGLMTYALSLYAGLHTGTR